MTQMFDHYPQPKDYVPHNRDCRPCCKKIIMMAGETTSHSFEVPFDVENEMIDYKIIYRLGLTDIVIKNKEDIEVIPPDERRRFSIMTCELTAEETALFAYSLLDCDVQLKFILKNNSTIYTEVYPVELSTAVDMRVHEEEN